MVVQNQWLILVAVILGVIMIFRRIEITQVGGHDPTGGDCCDKLNPCSPGLRCFYGVCVTPDRPEYRMIGHCPLNGDIEW